MSDEHKHIWSRFNDGCWCGARRCARMVTIDPISGEYTELCQNAAEAHDECCAVHGGVVAEKESARLPIGRVHAAAKVFGAVAAQLAALRKKGGL